MGTRVAAARARLEQVGWIADFLRAWDRASGLRFTRWAAGMSLFGYLALFPLAVLAFIVFGMVLRSHPSVLSDVEEFLKDAFPLLFDPQGDQPPVDIEQVARTTVSAGVISVIGLLYTGLGWVDATLEGVRRMQGAMRRPHGFVVLKVQDAVVLVLMGTVLLVALVGGVLAEALGSAALEWIGIGRLSSVLISGLLFWLTVTALYGMAWWNRPHRRWRVVVVGALITSVVLILMLQLSFLVVGRTLSNPVYGALAVAAALLFFLYLASSVLLYMACWVAVREGAASTAEEVAYHGRIKDRDPMLPTVSGKNQPDAGAAATSPPG